MKKLITFFVNLNLGAKTNNALHFVAGIITALIVHFLFEATGKLPEEWYYTFFFKALITWTIMKVVGERWEMAQVKHFGAKHSKLDVALGIVGGLLGIIVLSII